MKTARFLINNVQPTRTGLLAVSDDAVRAPIFGALNKRNRSLHQQARIETDRTLQTSAPCSPTSVPIRRCALHQGNNARPLLPKTPSLKSRASYSTESPIPREPTIHGLYEEKTGTWQYVVADPFTLKAVIIDSVLDYDPLTQAITTRTADSLLALISEKNYKIDRILETHAHADHLTAASYLQLRIAQEQNYKPPICIGKRITQVQDLFGQKYGIPANEYENVFDQLFDDDESFKIGNLTATVIHLPGHTPDHIGYKIADNVFCGDSLFNVDIGTARCDFPGGSAISLYESGRKLLQLPEHVKIWTGHDYPSTVERHAPVPWMRVRDHKEQNKHLSDDIALNDFVFSRRERDKMLAEPKLLHPSLQINIRAGRLPRPTTLGHGLLHLPIKLKGMEW